MVLGSIFDDFVIVFGALEVILDVFGSLLGALAVILVVFGSPKLIPLIFLGFSEDGECPRSKSSAKVDANYVVSRAVSDQSSRLQSSKS